MNRSHSQLLFNTLLALFIFILNSTILGQSQSATNHFFNNNFSGGAIVVNGQTTSNLPFEHVVWPDDNTTYTATAINNQFAGDYYRVFQYWTLNGVIRAYSLSHTYNYSTGYNGVNYSIYHDALFKKLCNLTFQGSSTVYINGSSRTPPWTETVIEQNTVTASGQWYYSNGIEYTFNHWTSNGQSYSSPITASVTKTYTAVYTGKPTNSGEYASASAPVGQPIVVTWTDNPNTAVNQFQIWRKVKHNGVVGSDVLLTTVGRGVQTYTDYDYEATDGYTHDLLWYDVRAYYSTEGTYSDPDFTAAFGRLSLSTSEDKLVASLSNELPVNYSISNYPNPFNPTTTINYQMPENGFVTIKVFDVLGKEIATLVNENKSSGYYKVNFDAGKLTSGIYIYTINANNFIQSKKMLLMK